MLIDEEDNILYIVVSKKYVTANKIIDKPIFIEVWWLKELKNPIN